MNLITVDKTKLIAILKENKEKHVKIFKEAYEEYRREYIEYLREAMRLAQGPGRVSTPDDYPSEPRCYVKSYDLAIQMMEWSVDETISLSEQDFRRYVKDEWEWTDDFYLSNSSYSSSSSSSGSVSSCSWVNETGDDIDRVFAAENME